MYAMYGMTAVRCLSTPLLQTYRSFEDIKTLEDKSIKDQVFCVQLHLTLLEEEHSSCLYTDNESSWQNNLFFLREQGKPLTFS